MLRYEMPVVYYILRRLCSGQQPFEPDWRVVDSVARASKDPSYRKPKFRRYLKEYSRDGLCCRRGKHLTPERKAYYEGIRRRKTEEFIRKNRLHVERRNNACHGGNNLFGAMKNIARKKL